MSLEAEEKATAATQPLHGKAAANAVRRTFSSRAMSGFVVVLTVLWTVPTLGLLVTSFRPKSAVGDSGWWTALLHPSFTLENYNTVLVSGGYNVAGGLLPYFVNSLVITVPVTLFALALASMAAYAIAWVPFRFNDVTFFSIFALQVVPLQLALIPLLRFFNLGVHIGSVPIVPAMHLSGTFFTVWIAHTMFAMPLAIFLIHNFMAQLPRDIMEAARVDGANAFVTFRRVVLPLSTPAIASFAIFQFLWVWNDLLVALTFVGGGDPAVSPLTSRLAQLTGSLGSRWDLLTAGAFVSIVVPLIVFFSLQRYFVRGLLAGSVKG